ncbi:hypothetical protein QW131_24410 [Roseibium salinum]|nr:hypothetical protein [Roseibium salinum]
MKEFPARHLQSAPLAGPPQGQGDVDDRRGYEGHLAQGTAPDPVVPHGSLVHRLDGNDAKGMIEEVAQAEDEQDEAAAEPQTLPPVSGSRPLSAFRVREGRLDGEGGGDPETVM